MKQRNIDEVLATTSPFSGFGRKQLEAISAGAERRSIADGAQLTRQGEFGHEMLLVLRGTGSVDVGGHTIDTIGPGDVVGEMSILDHGPRTATITATEPMEIAAITVRSFERLLDESPLLWKTMAEGLARRLRRADNSLYN